MLWEVDAPMRMPSGEALLACMLGSGSSANRRPGSRLEGQRRVELGAQLLSGSLGTRITAALSGGPSVRFLSPLPYP